MKLQYYLDQENSFLDPMLTSLITPTATRSNTTNEDIQNFEPHGLPLESSAEPKMMFFRPSV
jgi:hypothetical protein